MSLDLSGQVLREVQLACGKHLIIRRPKTEDAAKMIEYLNLVGGESDNLLFGKNEFRLTLEQEIDYIKNVNISEGSLMILGIIEDNIVSVAQVSSSNRKRISHNCDLSISVKKEYWGNGIGSIAMEELIKFAKDNAAIRNIHLAVKASNSNAISMYEKFGFEKIGVHKNCLNIDGNFDDEILMDLSIR